MNVILTESSRLSGPSYLMANSKAAISDVWPDLHIEKDIPHGLIFVYLKTRFRYAWICWWIRSAASRWNAGCLTAYRSMMFINSWPQRWPDERSSDDRAIN